MKAFTSIPAQCLAAFNAANGTSLTLGQVTFKDIRPVDSITPRPNTTKNTAITMMVGAGAPFTGEVTLFYDRTQLAVPFKNAPLTSTLGIKATTEKTIHALLPLINRRLGTTFGVQDILDGPVSLEKGFDVIVIRATAASQQFIGSVKLVVRRTVSFDTDVVVPYQGELWYKDHAAVDNVPSYPLTGKYPPALRTYLNDYSAITDFLKTLVASDTPTQLTDNTIGTNLANNMKAVDGYSWVFNTTGTRIANNLFKSYVMYNGPCAGFNLPSRAIAGIDEPHFAAAVGKMRIDEFDNVCVIANNNPLTGTNGYRSAIVLHYNDEVVK